MTIYIIKSGDTLGKIASAFGTTIDEIMAVNPQIDDENIIFAGGQINIPGNKVMSSPDDSEPKWLEIARQEMEAGVAEIPGKKDNQKIRQYHATTTLGATDDEVPWCSSFVNFCLEKAGIQGTNSAAARSWLKWGKSLSKPELGCVVVLWRGRKDSFQGHVGFYVGQESDGDLLLLGGNQSDRVKVSSFPKDCLLDYRMP